ncbi:hypothetical protein [Streptosporangium sp. NBC_01469]|uniref:hypothetical protein n=1 Tax=Streptosporangium sp. NBC_01469 TaxID=2903898 RepID=UPI002E28F9A2|nr:hypothetical protein [Streptosporangium sp. NBC_01469]
MTPEDLERMHSAALKRGVDPEELARQRQEALEECGSVAEMARWADFDARLDHYYRHLRGEFLRRY